MPASRWHMLPAAVYALVDETPGAVLLEGAAPGNLKSHEEPWTRLFTAPLRVCVAYDPSEAPGLFGEIERAVAAGLSAAGFFSYECGMAFEPKAAMRAPRPGTPLAWFGIYEREYVFDHQRGEFAGDAPPGLKSSAHAPTPQPTQAPFPPEKIEAEFVLREPDYASRIASIHEYIRAGDIYQLNFTAPFQVHASCNAAGLYARLHARQPAAYSAFLHWQAGRRVLSFSPELFFRIDSDDQVSGGRARSITTRPMKGTARRGRTTAEDRTISEWLQQDAKNRSENLMIVDLVRNDLGRVARFGTVRAESLFAVERLPSLWQMTSTITAELRDDAGFEAIFRALFPCGSITGAPKVRAMQLIAELEQEPRAVYTGAIGFFSPRQTVFNVAIRTLELDGGQGTMGVGSGIVIDSEAGAEYRECLLKAEFLTQLAEPEKLSLSETMLIETLLWEDGFPFLQPHLDRLADSAEYFDFPCERAAVQAALEAHARAFVEHDARRVRLLLDSQGEIRISDELLAGTVRDALLAGRPASDRIGRVCIAKERTDPADRFLFHKTTQRATYARALEEARRAGFDDVLFLNRRGEVTEGAISNIFIEKDGRWFTPAVESGLLPGVYRRYLLELRPEIEERVLCEDDLRAADGIYLANAVRGLRRVILSG